MGNFGEADDARYLAWQEKIGVKELFEATDGMSI